VLCVAKHARVNKKIEARQSYESSEVDFSRPRLLSLCNANDGTDSLSTGAKYFSDHSCSSGDRLTVSEKFRPVILQEVVTLPTILHLQMGQPALETV